MSASGQVIGIANAEKGYLEKSIANWNLYGVNCLYSKTKYAGADNVQKYSYETGHYGKYGWAPWCQSFVAWIFMAAFGADKANQLLCGAYKSASTMEVKDAMKKAGREVPLAKAQPGDIVFRSRNGGGHVGIVKGRKDGLIISIEGNSSAADITSWNGGAVVEHTGASWNWCMRPDWSLVEKSVGWHWVKADGKWYYQDSEGRNSYGWKDIKETAGELTHRYYFNKKGAMLTGLQVIDGEKYYLMDEGPLEGACCVTNANGALQIWNL